MARSRVAVRVEDLWKTYRIHPPGTRSRWLKRPSMDFHALRDVNLEVAEGTVLGVIGRNGAGKSTLLKIFSRITDPTRGRVTVYGRVASLLEVGTGFHPELTGRENVYLNAAIHGMKRREVTARLPAIIDFAQIGDFLDEPVKRYSSGMYLRLAFSIAAHLEPDILIVDEVLAVGDQAFQDKCLGKIGRARRDGRTTIVVSHNLQALLAVSTDGVYLDAGRVICHASIDETVRAYSRQENRLVGVFSASQSKPSITRVQIASEALDQGNIEIVVNFESPRVLTRPIVGIVLSTMAGQPIFGTNTQFHGPENPRPTSRGVARVRIVDARLHSSAYRVSAWLDDGQESLDQKIDAITFTYQSKRLYSTRPSVTLIGAWDPACIWTVEGDVL